jgi:hypothetical protein
MVWLPRNLPEPGRSSPAEPATPTVAASARCLRPPGPPSPSHGHRTHRIRPQPCVGQPSSRKSQLKAAKKSSRPVSESMLNRGGWRQAVRSRGCGGDQGDDRTGRRHLVAVLVLGGRTRIVVRETQDVVQLVEASSAGLTVTAGVANAPGSRTLLMGWRRPGGTYRVPGAASSRRADLAAPLHSLLTRRVSRDAVWSTIYLRPAPAGIG